MSSCPASPPINGTINGAFYLSSAVTIAGITDGTSNTFLYSERANGIFTAGGLALLRLVGRLRRGGYDLHDPVSDQRVQEDPACRRGI